MDVALLQRRLDESEINAQFLQAAVQDLQFEKEQLEDQLQELSRELTRSQAETRQLQRQKAQAELMVAHLRKEADAYLELLCAHGVPVDQKPSDAGEWLPLVD